MRRHGSVDAFGRRRPLWLTAAFLAATWTPELQANDFGRSSDTSARLAQAVTSDAPESQAAEGQDHQQAEVLARELAAARRDLELLLKLLNKARDESTRAKQAADRETAELRKALQQERDRTVRLNQDAENGADELRKSMLRDRAERMERDLGTIRRGVEPQTALAARTGDEVSPPKQAADAGLADLRKSLQQEHDRASRLEQDLAAARRDVETQSALAAKAGAEASQLKKTADAGTTDLRKSLQQERDRASRLEQDLAAARRDVETQTALAAKAGDEAARLKQGIENGSAELRQSLQQERDRVARLERDLALARSKENALAPAVAATDQINTQSEAEATKPAAAEQAAVAIARAAAQSNPEEIAGLVARANALLGRGDIGSARIVLERAAEAGNAQASFKLAETYDPLILSKWGTYGTRGDATKALDLYAKAQAGGIMEAKERLDALRP